jgi:hypothetical protein
MTSVNPFIVTTAVGQKFFRMAQQCYWQGGAGMFTDGPVDYARAINQSDFMGAAG